MSLNQTLKFYLINASIACRAEQNGAIQGHYRQWSRGEALRPLKDFFPFLRKIAISTPFGSHIARFLSYLKQLNCQALKGS